MVKQIFENLANRQMQGILFHSNMTDYYNFLTLSDLACLHHKQYTEEAEIFMCIKKYYFDHYYQKLSITAYETNEIFPVEWLNKTSMDVDKETLETLVQQSLVTYMDWEKETCDIFKECANRLFSLEKYNDYKFVRTLIDKVECEKSKILEIMTDLQSVDYNIYAIKGFQYKI